MAATLKDVAIRAGVSIKTVSNVVNELPTVTPAIRLRVQQTIDELGYRPNLLARNLRKGRSGVIALAVPEISSGYFGELAAELVKAAGARRHTILIDQTDGSRDRERFLLAGAQSHMIDGLVLSPAGLEVDDLAECLSGPTPFVLLGEHLYHPQVDHVEIDNIAAARAATEHLLALGRRRIMALGMDAAPAMSGGRLRYLGYVEALNGADLAGSAHARAVRALNRRGGAEAAARFLRTRQRPDALVCYNDAVALGAMRTLLKAGVRIPDDIAVIGIDDIEDGRFSTPSLTSIAPDKTALATKALDLLLGRIAGRTTPAQDVHIGFQLIVRESTTGRAT